MLEQALECRANTFLLSKSQPCARGGKLSASWGGTMARTTKGLAYLDALEREAKDGMGIAEERQRK